MTDPIKKHPLRWFYVAMALALFAASFGIFYMGAHYSGITRIVIYLPAACVAQLVPRMVIRAIWGE